MSELSSQDYGQLLFDELTGYFGSNVNSFLNLLSRARFPLKDLPNDNADNAVTKFIEICNRKDRSSLQRVFELLSQECASSSLLYAIYDKIRSMENNVKFFSDVLDQLPSDLPSRPLQGNDSAPPANTSPGGLTPAAGTSLSSWQVERINVVAKAGHKVDSTHSFSSCQPDGKCILQPHVLYALGELTRTGEATTETLAIAQIIERILPSTKETTRCLYIDQKPPDKLVLSMLSEALNDLHSYSARTFQGREFQGPPEKKDIPCDCCDWLSKFLSHRTRLQHDSWKFASSFSIIYHRLEGVLKSGAGFAAAFTMAAQDDFFCDALRKCAESVEPLKSILMGAVLPERQQSLVFLRETLMFPDPRSLAAEIAGAVETLHKSPSTRVFKSGATW